MDYKDKAKAYDCNYKVYTELINRLEDVKDAIKKHNYGIAMDILYKPYPEFQITISTELKESERIRKSLIDYFNRFKSSDMWNESFSFGDVVSWIEKQGKLIDEYEDRLDRCACESFNKGYKAAIEHQKEKPADKIEPKFKVGDWIVYDKYYIDKIVKFDNDKAIFESGEWLYVNQLNEDCKLWTIEDAKDGDILCSSTYHLIWMYKDDEHYYACVNTKYVTKDINGLISIPNDTCPANKEQCDLLFQKIHESGYEWDAEKKKLKKIEQGNSPLLSNSSNNGKDEQKPSWSEEDIEMLNSAILFVEHSAFTTIGKGKNNVISWLKSLRDRAQPQPKQEWSEEDKEHIESILKRLDGMCKKGATFTKTHFAVNQDMDWLKSLRPQVHWKPTKEQMDALWRRIAEIKISDERPSDIYILGELYEQLENL